jgi:hypothetical protein
MLWAFIQNTRVLFVNNENHNFKVFGTLKLTSCFLSMLILEKIHLLPIEDVLQ